MTPVGVALERIALAAVRRLQASGNAGDRLEFLRLCADMLKEIALAPMAALRIGGAGQLA